MVPIMISPVITTTIVTVTAPISISGGTVIGLAAVCCLAFKDKIEDFSLKDKIEDLFVF